MEEIKSLNRIEITLNKQLKQIEELESGVKFKLIKAMNENQQLKQQLAEKDKEISNLRGLVNERDKQIKNLKTNKKRVIEHKNNVKISFAVEQLEKVKETAECVLDNALKNSSLNESYYDRLLDEIDNQIKELKKGME